MNAISTKSVLIPSNFIGSWSGSRANCAGLRFGRWWHAQGKDVGKRSPHTWTGWIDACPSFFKSAVPNHPCSHHSPCPASALWSTLPLALSRLSPTILLHRKPLRPSRNPRNEVWGCLVFPIESLYSCWWPQWEFLRREPIRTPPEI